MAQMTSLGAAITTTNQSSITVAEYLGFPATGEFTILIDSEWLRVTAGNGTATWTVTRGYGGTTAATHLIAATITHVEEAYGTLGDLTDTLALGTATDRYALLSAMLADVSAEISDACGRQFYRSPQVSGTETFYLDVPRSGMDSLSLATLGVGCTDGKPLDIVSITSLYTRTSESGAYVEIVAGDTGYYLQPGTGAGTAGTVWPYEDVVLSPRSSVSTFPVGFRAVKVIGVRGFASVPAPVKRATITEVRERFRQSISGNAQPEGVNRFGVPMFLTGKSDDMRTILSPPYVKRSYAAI